MPSTAQPLEIECVACNDNGDAGCEVCSGIGKIQITDCPLKIITDDIWEMVMLAELFQKGLPPVAGGVLDQAKIFVEAARFVFREQAYWKKKLGIIT